MAEYKKFGFRSALSKPYEIAELDEILQKWIIEALYCQFYKISKVNK